MNKHIPLIILLISAFHFSALSQNSPSSLAGKVICVDPGHGGTATTDPFRVGPSGEREEWVNLRVSLLLKELLEEKGATVVMTRMGDENIGLAERVEIVRKHSADLFLSIHHNATADPRVNFPIIYFHGNASENQAGVALGKEIARGLVREMYHGETPVSLVSDHTIFSKSGTAVLRGTYGIPAVLAEASFFTNPEEELRLRQEDHNRREAQAYLQALEAFFDRPIPPILEKNSLVSLPRFRTFQEAERMSETALMWHQDYQQGLELMESQETLDQAYELFTRSARSFPDSYVAGECHKHRAEILNKLGKPTEAEAAALRAAEFFVETKKDQRNLHDLRENN